MQSSIFCSRLSPRVDAGRWRRRGGRALKCTFVVSDLFCSSLSSSSLQLQCHCNSALKYIGALEAAFEDALLQRFKVSRVCIVLRWLWPAWWLSWCDYRDGLHQQRHHQGQIANSRPPTKVHSRWNRVLGLILDHYGAFWAILGNILLSCLSWPFWSILHKTTMFPTVRRTLWRKKMTNPQISNMQINLKVLFRTWVFKGEINYLQSEREEDLKC